VGDIFAQDSSAACGALIADKETSGHLPETKDNANQLKVKVKM